MMAYCGIDCLECPTYQATQKDDDQKRAKVAERWSKIFNFTLKPSDINCDGCKEEGKRLFFFCRNCEVRECGSAKGLENCAHCEDYACDKLEPLFKMIPFIKEKLEEMRKAL